MRRSPIKEGTETKPFTIAISKPTKTHADVFAAIGLADLLSTSAARIKESATGFEISAGDVDLDTLRHVPGYPYLKTRGKAVPSGVRDFVDWDQEKQKVERYFKLRRDLKSNHASSEIDELLRQEAPRPDHWQLKALDRLQGDETTNRVYLAIIAMTPGDLSSTVSSGLAAIALSGQSQIHWGAKGATSVQLFNPLAAKGYAARKPSGTNRNDGTKEQWTDEFVEWLRYRGYFAAACPHFLNRDIRLLVPIPHDISLAGFRQAIGELSRERISGGAPKIDILAALALAEILIRHSEEYGQLSASRPYCRIRFKTPSDIISGLHVTHYQSMGQAPAVSSMSVVALPGWFLLNSADDARSFLAILTEHHRICRGLNDEHSDEIALLLTYRRFLEARGEQGIISLLEFMAGYGQLVLRAWNQQRKLKQFTTDNFERLMENNKKLSEILSDPGFRSVAKAIRKATVNAQAQKANKRPDYREIRYDLIPQLKRASTLPGNEPLIRELSEFVSSYNIENARRRELKKPAPPNITTEEFESLVKLIDEHRASTVGIMLCAYGACRDPDAAKAFKAQGEPAPDVGLDDVDAEEVEIAGSNEPDENISE